MGRRAAAFTQTDLERAMKVARAADPRAVLEVTRDGTIRILPAESGAPAPEQEGSNTCDAVFGSPE